jgi:hypothetical protein
VTVRRRHFAVPKAETTLRRLIRPKGAPLESIPVAQAFTLMIEFFTKWHPDGLSDEDGADGLLHQWGEYDWGVYDPGQARNPKFELDLTRQFLVPEHYGEPDEGHEFFHLQWTYRYEPSDITRELGEGDQWFFAPTAQATLTELIVESPVVALASTLTPVEVTLQLGAV